MLIKGVDKNSQESTENGIEDRNTRNKAYLGPTFFCDEMDRTQRGLEKSAKGLQDIYFLDVDFYGYASVTKVPQKLRYSI